MVPNATGLLVLGIALVSGVLVLYYAIGTLVLAAYPQKSHYKGIINEARLFALLIKKHIVGLSGTELGDYERNVDVAKNIFFSVLALPLAPAAVICAVVWFSQSPNVNLNDIVITALLLLVAIYQIRVYGSEKRIYDDRVPISPFARKPEFDSIFDTGTKAEVQREEARRESEESIKPIYDRIDRRALSAAVKETDVKKLIDEDKERVEKRLSKSDLSKLFEISGQPSSKKQR